MSTLTPTGSDPIFTQQREMRALALQAAATYYSGREDVGTGIILLTARTFEDYIEDGTWKGDPEA